MILKLSMDHQGLKVYKVYINDDPGLTLTYFTAGSNLVEIAQCTSDQYSGERLQDCWSSGYMKDSTLRRVTDRHIKKTLFFSYLVAVLSSDLFIDVLLDNEAITQIKL